MQKETTGGYKVATVLCKQVLTISKGKPSSSFCNWDQMNSKESFKSHIRPYHPSALDCPRLPSHFHPLPSAQRPAPSTSPCSLSPDTLVFMLFLQPARSAPSLGPPASDSPTPGDCMAPPSHHSGHVRHQLFKQAARMSAPPLSLCHICPHKNRSPIRQSFIILLHRLPHISGTERDSETSNWGHQQSGHL